MVEPLRHHQTKEAATDMFYLPPPRHISTLPKSGPTAMSAAMSGSPESGDQASLFDHLVGAGKHGSGHVEAEHLGGGQVDDEIELGRLFDRKVGGGCSASKSCRRSQRHAETSQRCLIHRTQGRLPSRRTREKPKSLEVGRQARRY